MLTMNRATVLGHAGRDPEMRTLQSGGEVALFSLATTERFTRRDGTAGEATEWHAIVAFGNAARTVRKMVRRGAAVLVEGRIATRTWTDRTGREHRTSEILVSGPQARVNVLTKRGRGSGGNDDPPGRAEPAGATKAATEDAGEVSADAAAVADGTAGSGAVENAGAEGDADTGPDEDAGPSDGADAGPGADGGQSDGAAGPPNEDAGHDGEDVASVASPEGTASAEAASGEPDADSSGDSGSSSDTGTGEAEAADAGNSGSGTGTAGADGRTSDADHD